MSSLPPRHRVMAAHHEGSIRRSHAMEPDEELFVLDPGSRVFVSFTDDWSRAAMALATDLRKEFPWDLPEDLNPGDLLVTVLGCDPPLVSCIEKIDSVGDEIMVSPRFTVTSPTPFADITDAIGIKSPHTTGPLAHEPRKLLKALREAIDATGPLLVATPDCSDPSTAQASSAVVVKHLLQGPGQRFIECAACGAQPDELEGHYFDLLEQGAAFEIQDLAHAVTLLCHDCHALAHPASLQALRNARRPACPECGAPNPRKYLGGMLTPPADDELDSYIIVGCVMPEDGFFPDYRCRICHTDFEVSVLRTDDPSTLWD